MKKTMGRIRFHVALDCSAYSLETFILDNIEPGSIIATDSWRSYNFIDNDQYGHEKTNQSSSKNNENLYGVHLVASLIKRLIRGTYHGYVFRFNRRKSKSIGKKFMRIVQQVVKSVKVTYDEIKWDIDPIS
jgi:retron-type reverse transcriptase